MEIRLLKKGYKTNEQFYKDFLEDQIKDKEEYFSDKVSYIPSAPDFPIYMGKGNESDRKPLFIEAFSVLSNSYINTERDIHFEEVFWHSLLVVYKRDFLLENYPMIKDSYKDFRNIVVKDFNWENYIYKCVLGAQYVNDRVVDEQQRNYYYELIIENLDMYNYMIKYEIFRNEEFLLNILDIIKELDLSKVMKSQIKDRPDLGKDPRVGRLVIFEFNKSYPIVMSPMLDKAALKELFLEYLSYYYNMNKIHILVKV